MATPERIGLDNLLGSRSPRQSLIEDIKFNDRQRVQSMLADGDVTVTSQVFTILTAGFRQTSDGGRRTEYPSTHDEYAASNIQRACAPVSRNPWESEVSARRYDSQSSQPLHVYNWQASPHLSRQGSSVGAWADLKYSDAARQTPRCNIQVIVIMACDFVTSRVQGSHLPSTEYGEIGNVAG